MIKEVVNCNKMQADKKKQQINTLFDNSVPKNLVCDKTRIQQIVNNLLGNAIKFSDERTRITVECYYMPEHQMFQVTVIDQGIQISDEEAALLFTPYTTLPSARSTNQAGPGLGLYICRSLCKQMNGEIALCNHIDPEIGVKAFLINVKATVPEFVN